MFDLSALLARISLEIQAFLAAADRRPYLIGRLGELYDLNIKPLNLPGPDFLLDPALRAILIYFAGMLYDALAPRFDRDDPPTWSPAPEVAEPTEEAESCG